MGNEKIVPQLTLGEWKVEWDEKESSEIVKEIKSIGAEYIDLIGELIPFDDDVEYSDPSDLQLETYNLLIRAMHKIEEGTMLAVKAVTKKEWI